MSSKSRKCSPPVKYVLREKKKLKITIKEKIRSYYTALGTIFNIL